MVIRGNRGVGKAGFSRWDNAIEKRMKGGEKKKKTTEGPKKAKFQQQKGVRERRQKLQSCLEGTWAK